MMGMKATIPLREKSRQKPYITGCGQGKGVLEDTFSVLCQFRTKRSQAPTPGPLNLTEEPDPEKLEKTAVFRSLSDSFFSDPLPLAPLFTKTRKKRSSKRVPLYRLLRLLLETAKTGRRVTFWDGKWPILWHISCFAKPRKSIIMGPKAIRKLQKKMRRAP